MTISPTGCQAGYYQDETNEDTCKDCPVGYYCYTNTTDYTPNECPSGYYCPLNTPDPYAYPCPTGTFNNLTVQHSDSACLECTPGMYCAGEGNSAPTGECSPGWYCSGGANESMVSCFCSYFWSTFSIPYHCTFSMGTFKERPIHLHSEWRKW